MRLSRNTFAWGRTDLSERWPWRLDAICACYSNGLRGWQDRLEQHSRHLAKLESDATEALVKTVAVDWVRRQETQREEEWATRCKLLEMARKAIQRWEDNPKRCESLASIARVLELTSKLGRLASGMATDRTEVKEEFEGQLDMDWEMAIRKVYGEPAEVVDVEARRLNDAST